jgi:hypothetical protein
LVVIMFYVELSLWDSKMLRFISSDVMAFLIAWSKERWFFKNSECYCEVYIL